MVGEAATSDTTDLLSAWQAGDAEALEALLPRVYGDLRVLARRYLRGERPDHTLQPTALVHEAFLRLVDQRRVQWRNRGHFVGVAAQAMRRILIDHARRQVAGNRVGAGDQVTLVEERAPAAAPLPELLDVDRALARLARLDPRQARLVELRFFGGLTVREAAAALGLSPATAVRDWQMAKAWLKRALQR